MVLAMRTESLRRQILESARGAGFAMAGFARLRHLAEREEFYRRWLAEGRGATMTYLAREPERRFDPRRLDPRLRSVVSLAYPYAAPGTAPPAIDWRAELRGRIAAYALGPDYHDHVLTAAHAVAATVTGACPGAATRAYVDTGPVFERDWAAECGLGWFGKNTMLLSREHGSYFFLAEIFTDLELDAPESAYRDHCGTCSRCLDLCPTGALAEGYRMEPRRCISYLTIEHRGAIAPELRAKLANWIFGCDICQAVCPWNGDAPAGSAGDLWLDLTALLELDQAAFSRRFSKSAIKRARRGGLLRNAAIVLGNTRNPAAIAPLARALAGDPDPLVRGHAAWALGQIGGGSARRPLEQGRRRETDPQTRVEIGAALAALDS
jgi:epoxyqueuosine reductase